MSKNSNSTTNVADKKKKKQRIGKPKYGKPPKK